eukprot:g7993.t1
MEFDTKSLTLGFAAGAAAALLLTRGKSSASKAGLPRLVLHLYDHCPFCIRVELVLGWKGIPYERVVYGYGDTLGSKAKGLYYGGTTLTGDKQLPVLAVHDGAGAGAAPRLIPESGDIIAFLEDATGPGNVLLPPASGRADLKRFFESKGAFKQVQRRLTRGRVLEMTDLTDWAREEDRAYAKAKYEGQGFDYAAAEATAAEDARAAAELLRELDGMLRGADSLNGGPCGLTWDDLAYLPELRTLSCAQGVAWPARLRAYVEGSFARAGVGTYFDRTQ